jgi:hypothetical protein
MAPVFQVLIAKPIRQVWLLKEVDKRDQEGRHDHGVDQQSQLAKQQSLPSDRRNETDVYRIAHVSILPADNEVLGRRDRSRGTQALGGEPNERAHECHRTSGDKAQAQYFERSPERQGSGEPPACQPPWDQAHDGAGRDREKDRAAERGPEAPAQGAGRRDSQVLTRKSPTART